MNGTEEKLIVKSTGSKANVRLPDLTPEIVEALDGRKVLDQDGVEYELKLKKHAVVEGDALQNIEAEIVEKENTLYLGDGKNVLSMQWDDNKYLNNLYGDYLNLVQNSDVHFAEKILGRYPEKIYDEHSCFEDFCKDCVVHLKEQRKLFKLKRDNGTLDLRQYNNALMLLDASEETLRKFLDGTIKF